MTSLNNALLHLAYESGWKSRFKLDPRFAPDFERLYSEWIAKALEDKSGKVFGVIIDNVLAGMVTCSVSKNIGKIGLISVDERFRKQGIGRLLMRAAEAYYRERDADECEVVTQSENKGACQLYMHIGYTQKSVQKIWHIWR